MAEPSDVASTVISRNNYEQLYKAYQDSKIPFEGRYLKTTPVPMHTTCSVMELQKTAYQMSPEFCEAGGKMNKYAHTEFFSYNSIKKIEQT